jgi:hypothetical protein
MVTEPAVVIPSPVVVRAPLKKDNDATQKPLNTQKAAETNCENQVVHSFFLRDSEYSAASALRRRIPLISP